MTHAALRRFARWLEHRTPRALLRRVAYSGWNAEGFTDTRATRFADWVLWKLAVAEAIGRCLFGKSHDTVGCDWWVKLGHRAKAIACLLLGRHWKGDGFCFDGFEVTIWNWRRVSWEYNEWEGDRLEVGWGWKNWRVALTVHEW